MAKKSLPGAGRRGRPPKNHWPIALSLSENVVDRYAMRRNEQEAAFTLALKLPPKSIIVELGVTHGRTASLLCYAAQITKAKYFGIDNFRMETTAANVRKTLTKLNLPHTIIQGDTGTVPWNSPIDFLLFDAGHDDLNMRTDTRRWLPFLKPGGFALFHDYNPNSPIGDPHFPVKRWADYYTQNWPTISYIPYLLVKQKPAPPKL